MIRIEFVATGAVLAVLGIALCVAGYRKTEPSPVAKVVSFAEQITGERAPSDVKERLASPKREGYVFIAAGAVVAVAGIALLLTSRTAQGSSRSQEGENRS